MCDNNIPLMYFLTSVIMVDDNRSFLDNFGMELNYPGVLESYTSPREAIESILSKNNIFNSLKDYLIEIESNEFDNDCELHSINYDSIIKKLFDEKRFYEPSVIIVDYSMPEMNGVEFCRRIKKHPSLKLMLTGEADYKLAVEAFNEGIIDQFIMKDVNTSKIEVVDAVKNLSMEYFKRFSSQVLRDEKSILKSDQYKKIFNDWINEKNIIEYYSISNTGSNLGMDSKGNMRWLISCLSSDITHYIDVGVAQGASESLLNLLSSKKIQLALFTEVQKKEPVSSWVDYMVNIDGSFQYNNEVLHYSFLDNFTIKGVINDKVKRIYDVK